MIFNDGNDSGYMMAYYSAMMVTWWMIMVDDGNDAGRSAGEAIADND